MSRRTAYPRPDFERSEWMSLNGAWHFAFDEAGLFSAAEPRQPEEMPLTIEVPYVYQCALSGINSQEEHPAVWYCRSFEVPETFADRIFLCFGAVDWRCEVWVNDLYAGGHEGGYTPFSLDITGCLRKGGLQKVTVRAEDTGRCDQPRGKQSWEHRPTRCWYTPSTGIWQSVWLENRPQQHIAAVSFHPDLPDASVEIELELSCEPGQGETVQVNFAFQGKQTLSLTLGVQKRFTRVSVPVVQPDAVDEMHLWSPEMPNLYEVCLEYTSERGKDTVRTYFGMRSIQCRDGQVLLNGKPFYQRLVLHQGYYDGGLLTADTDERFRSDLMLIREMGFNGIRMHQKIEDPLLYYWADRLGLVVWGELPSSYEYTPYARHAHYEMLEAFVQRDFNHPSIICWVPFNESWGVRNICENRMQQEYVEGVYHYLKFRDPQRLVSTNDGWEQVSSDLCGIHDYAPDARHLAEKWEDVRMLVAGAAQERMLYAHGYHYQGQPVILTEFGGIAYKTAVADEDWGYHGIETSKEDFLNRFAGLVGYIQKHPDIRGYCYTQFTDVMQETNGLADIGRNVKVPIEEIRKVLNPET